MKFSGSKKVLFGLFIFLFLCMGFLPAHAPKEVTLVFDLSQAVLQVNVLHPVKNPETHYIKRIRVYVNEEMVAETTYEKQDSDTSHSAVFTLKEVKAGDEIQAKATCSRIGAKKASITVK
jgi:desulfoferrodoxin (superoxide reductase-like protein)